MLLAQYRNNSDDFFIAPDAISQVEQLFFLPSLRSTDAFLVRKRMSIFQHAQRLVEDTTCSLRNTHIDRKIQRFIGSRFCDD
jgi:hypothetical protein